MQRNLRMSPNCYLTFALLIILQNVGSELISDDIHNHLGSKTPYRFKYQKDELKIKYPGCKSTKIWMLIRHGSRLPSHKDIKGMNTTLKNLSYQILLGHKSGKGQLTKEQLSKLENWSSDIDITEEKDLVAEGKDEMYQLSKRMQKRFPNIIKTKYNNEAFDFRFTPTERAEESAKNFANGLFHKNSHEVAMTKTSDGDPVLRFYKKCDKWQKQVKKNPKTYIEQEKISKSMLMNRTLESISQKLGLNFTVDLAAANLMYKACAYETAWWKGHIATWCSAFDKDTVKVLEYYQDLKHYLMDGYGNELTRRIACHSVKTMFDTLTSKSSPNATFLFAHSGTVLKVLAHLGLYRPQTPLTGDGIPENNVWRMSDIDCFASNIAFVLFECKTGDHLLILHQERVVRLPVCDKDLCPMRHLLDAFSDTINKCDHDALCSIQNTEL